jgi:hypothetical protein
MNSRKTRFENRIKSSFRSIHDTPEAKITRNSYESPRQFQSRQQKLLNSRQTDAVNKFTSALRDMWPCRIPTRPEYDSLFEDYIYVERAMTSVRSTFATWFDNKCFYDYLGQIANSLHPCRHSPLKMPWTSFAETPYISGRMQAYVNVDDVFPSQAPSPPIHLGTDTTELISPERRSAGSTARLSKMMVILDRQAISDYEKAYLEHLRNSVQRLQEHFNNTRWVMEDSNISNILHQHLACCRGYFESIYDIIMSAVHPENVTSKKMSRQRQKCLRIVLDANHWPRLSPSFFLEQLKHGRWCLISASWKNSIVGFGLALTELHRVERLVASVENRKDLVKELRNPGHRNWSPHDYPDSLLLEIESGIMIRDVQEDIPREMRSRAAGANAVMQLNMGEGKSSVIVPIVASALADGSRLVRVVVAKPQAKQVFQMLVSKLGGMVGRRVYHLPFSRALKINSAQAEEITLMCRECMENGGVLLVQPEQILSLKLMGLECLITGKDSVGRALLKTQAFFDKYSHDIVDESDENFSVKFELIYTMGDQKSVQLSPERWMLIHQVLDLVKKILSRCEKEVSTPGYRRCTGRKLSPDACLRA